MAEEAFWRLAENHYYRRFDHPGFDSDAQWRAMVVVTAVFY
jgi:hypothetical protein